MRKKKQVRTTAETAKQSVGPIDLTGSTAEDVVSLKVKTVLRFAYRKQPDLDVGIDGHIETLDDSNLPTGQLIGVQVKAAPKPANGKIIFYGERKHYNYWRNHCLPVVLFLVNVEEEKAYWRPITEASATQTRKGWRIAVDESNLLTEQDRKAFLQLVPSPSDSTFLHRLRRLILDRKLISAAQDRSLRGELRIRDAHTLETYTGGQFEVPASRTLTINSAVAGDNVRFLAGVELYGDSDDIHHILSELFPWATVSLDLAEYEEDDLPEYEQTELISEGDDAPYSATPRTLQEWQRDTRGNRFRSYYDHLTSETVYAFKLELNEIGGAFYVLSFFLDKK